MALTAVQVRRWRAAGYVPRKMRQGIWPSCVCLYEHFSRPSGLVGRLLMGGEILGIAGPMDRRLNAAARTGAFQHTPS